MAKKFNGVQKIALLLTALGDEAAAKVMGEFNEPEQRQIGQCLVELEDADIGDADIEAVLEEFRELTRSGSVFKAALSRTLNSTMEKLHGEQMAQSRVAEIRNESRSRYPFLALRGLRSADLAKVIATEHPQLQAIILANLESEQAAEILSEIPDEQRPAIVSRMATMEEPSPPMLRRIAEQLAERTRGLRREVVTEEPAEERRLATVADILNATDPGVDKEILKKLEESNEDLGNQIREKLFTWQDLADIDKRTMQKVLAGIDTKLLALGLKKSDEDVAAALLGATSQRTKDMVLEEKELLGAVAVNEVLEAQKQILATVRELNDSGEITINKGKGAAYVE